MRALITGVTGQDGSYMAELLLSKGYEVFGIVRRSSVKKFDRIEALMNDIELVEGDLTDQSSLDSVIHSVQPDEVYNLAAQSFVPVSWNQPVLTGDVTGLGVIRVLEAIRKHRPKAKFLRNASEARSRSAPRRWPTATAARPATARAATTPVTRPRFADAQFTAWPVSVSNSSGWRSAFRRILIRLACWGMRRSSPYPTSCT